MGNSLLRENRWQQDTQEIPWTPKNQSPKQRTSRCCYCYFAEGCFCLPWRKICIFKAKPDSPKESKEMSSAPTQDSADQSSSEDLCYTLINHSVLGGKSSGISTERHSSSPEDEYELIIPRRVFYSLQQPHPPTPHLENRVSY
ncbi:Germinal center-associated signaling and motility protein [Vulpes lagopus]